MTEALRAIRGPLFGLFLAAVDTGDNKAASTLSGRLHENLARTAKLTGELVPHAGTSITNILLSPDFPAVARGADRCSPAIRRHRRKSLPSSARRD